MKNWNYNRNHIPNLFCQWRVLHLKCVSGEVGCHILVKRYILGLFGHLLICTELILTLLIQNCWCDRYVTLVLPNGKHTHRQIQTVVVNILELWPTYRLKSGRTSTNLELSNTTYTALLCCSGNYSVNNNRSRAVIFTRLFTFRVRTWLGFER